MLFRSLAGAQFTLWRESNGTPGLQRTGTPDTQAGTCQSQADGTCAIGNLVFGTYYWEETAAPAGYTLPADPVSPAIRLRAITAVNTARSPAATPDANHDVAVTTSPSATANSIHGSTRDSGGASAAGVPKS